MDSPTTWFEDLIQKFVCPLQPVAKLLFFKYSQSFYTSAHNRTTSQMVTARSTFHHFQPTPFIMAAESSASEGPAVVAISIVFALITLVVIVLRLFSRFLIVLSAGVDDGKLSSLSTLQYADTYNSSVLMIAAAVSSILHCSSHCLGPNSLFSFSLGHL